MTLWRALALVATWSLWWVGSLLLAAFAWLVLADDFAWPRFPLGPLE